MGHCSREHTIFQIREFRDGLAKHIEQGATLVERLNRLLLQVPLKTLFLFEPTRHEFLERISALKGAETFLSGVKASERILVDGTFMTRHRYAEKLLNRTRSKKKNSTSQINQALQLVRDQLLLATKKLKQFEKARRNIETIFREFLQHLHSSKNQGLTNANGAPERMELVARYVLEEPNLAGGKQSEPNKSVSDRAFAILKGKPARKLISELLTNYLTEIERNINRVTEDNKHKFLKHAARRRVIELEECCRCHERERSPALVRAITGIYFAYACEQHLELGKMNSQERRRHEQTITKATPKELYEAILLILETGVLSREQFALFRYHHCIYSAFLEVRQ